MSAYSLEICSSTLFAHYQALVSTNFPEDYGNNLKKSWLLEAPENHRITIQFISFDIEDEVSLGRSLCYCLVMTILQNLVLAVH